MDPVDVRAIAMTVLLLLLPALLVPAAPAGGDGPITDGGDGLSAGTVTLVSVEYPPQLDPFNYSDVLVLINNNSQMSRDVGEYFAQSRGVPWSQVAYLDVPAREVITKDQFEDLKDQVKAFMRSGGLVDKVDYIVTTKGFPLKIYNQSLLYEACVDEELALLFGRLEANIGNYFYVPNPYYGDRTYFSRAEQGIYLVNRLTGYDWDDVKGIIDRAGDSYGNRGLFVLDVDPTKGFSPGGYGDGNIWLRDARDILVDRGEDVLYDETMWYVTYQEDVMGYASWGSNDANDTDHAKPHNTWVNGSIAETFVSTGGRTFTWPPRYGQSMVADLIRENVTGVKGYVFEPFLSAIAHPDILFERYTAGFNLAESYRMASVMLGWMGVVVGDPKCSPYRDVPDLHIDDSMLVPSNVTPLTGDDMTLRVQVKNLGGPFPNATLSLYVDDELELRTNVDLDGFSLTTLDITMAVPPEPVEHQLQVYLNDLDEPVFETTLDNNYGTTYIVTVDRPSITLSAQRVDALTLETVGFSVHLDYAPRFVTHYYFDFGDGSAVVPQGSNTTHHDFADDGAYTVRGWVRDETGILSRVAEVQVTVRNRDPSPIIAVEPSQALTGETLTFNASRSSDMDGSLLAVSWDLGDGNSSDGWEARHAYRWPGEYTVRLTVTDDDGAKASVTRRITILNRSPKASLVLDGEEVWKGVPATFNASASDDQDGRVMDFEWDFGDGSEGAVGPSPWAVHTFQHAGRFTVALTVTDDRGAVDSSRLDILVLNRAPVAGLLVAPVETPTGAPVTLDATASEDADGQVVTFTFTVTRPSGEMDVLGSGAEPTMVFTPDDDGAYVLGLTVTDDDGAVANISRQLLVTNRPPSAVLDEATAALEGTVFLGPGSLPLGVMATDPDGEVTSVVWYRGSPGGEVVAEGATLSLAVTEEAGLTLVVLVTDDDGDTAAAWLNVTVNLPPVAAFAFFHAVDDREEGVFHPGDDIAFDASGSSDPGGLVSYQWDMGDGAVLSGREVEHAYGSAGTFRVTLKVTDAHGASEATTLDVVVAPTSDEGEPLLSGWVLAALVLVVVAAVAMAALMVLRRSGGPEADR